MGGANERAVGAPAGEDGLAQGWQARPGDHCALESTLQDLLDGDGPGCVGRDGENLRRNAGLGSHAVGPGHHTRNRLPEVLHPSCRLAPLATAPGTQPRKAGCAHEQAGAGEGRPYGMTPRLPLDVGKLVAPPVELGHQTR